MTDGLKRIKQVFRFCIHKGIVTWLLLIALWGIASLFVSGDFLPGPMATVQGSAEIISNGVLLQYIRVSLMRILSGWFLGVLIAIPLGLLIGQFSLVRDIMEPFINFFRFIPAIGFLTLFLMWFGVGETSKIVLILYATVFLVVINTIAGVVSIDPTKFHAAESQGANAFQKFYTITIPASVPHIFTGIRLGLSSAIISIVAAEMLAAQEGVGYLIYTSRLYFRTDWIFTGIVTLGLIGYLSDKLLRIAGSRFLRHYGVKENE